MPTLTRARMVGALGIVIAAILMFAVNANLNTKLADARERGSPTAPASVSGYVSNLYIPQPKTPPGTDPVVEFGVPTLLTTFLFGGALIIGGVTLIVRNPERRGIGAYMSSVIAVTFVVLLLWAVAGNRVDLSDTLARVIRLATPLALGSLAGLVCERSGVVNIGIEGMMLTGACFGYTAAMFFGNRLGTTDGNGVTTIAEGAATTSLWFGVLVAVLVGGLMAALHALLAINFKVDQIISGTVINIMAVGVTGYVRSNFLITYESPVRSSLQDWNVPFLSDIPFLGPLFFTHKPITFLMIALVLAFHVLLFRTVWGLRTRAIGEHPKAADTVGIQVNRMRFRNVILGGMLAGLAGAWFALEANFRFDDLMTNGQGFIALAAMIFGKWTPLGAFGGALLFSSANALQLKVQNYNFAMPPQFLQMLPYIVTIIVLAGVIGRARPPAAAGQPYEK